MTAEEMGYQKYFDHWNEQGLLKSLSLLTGAIAEQGCRFFIYWAGYFKKKIRR
ncbi:hypothetical protein JCM9140_3051 [Halalkalibacter wakoensis JCM 9140]|uniref:Uncharacterized protein n=1 Tax=Halalkalibacter wakoensis JCM 9140 TaxID=1236970 RepID=W4Q4F3_9BACI|nr:hypothetical protein JCM9140_3051 [Halalkalibacter wakoensis JCM 9140]